PGAPALHAHAPTRPHGNVAGALDRYLLRHVNFELLAGVERLAVHGPAVHLEALEREARHGAGSSVIVGRGGSASCGACSGCGACTTRPTAGTSRAMRCSSSQAQAARGADLARCSRRSWPAGGSITPTWW